MDMTYRGGECGREGGGQDGVEWGGKWDNCNSIINKYIKKKSSAIVRCNRWSIPGGSQSRLRLTLIQASACLLMIITLDVMLILVEFKQFAKVPENTVTLNFDSCSCRETSWLAEKDMGDLYRQ